MLPLRDDIVARRYPVFTVVLIGINLLVFLDELAWGRRLPEYLFLYGIVPVRYTDPDLLRLFHPVQQAIPFVSSMFLHGGWLHLLGNMWTLWVFGDNVEDRLGRFRYILLYVSGGACASLLHIVTNASSAVPTIGASGAVAAVMGAYFRFYPRADVTVLIPPFFLGPFFRVPAVFFLLLWFILQFYNGTLSLVSRASDAGGIAWWAHIGGFIFGALAGRALARHPNL
ncbi:MAG TPA: rhomboid family intramembrane serine protease [Candidatus Paceibacterota bacterium]|nr:rhomboid family intramembrane serine protease [Verrucomicrobiota bacterium]HRZ43794.1 rhomboid family intramembrane serine protease [Candidatus Paceibacterota bacterium]HRZ92592.1 rhomboid family intramembrane serine protease [Candidatus Paceibacterota bacterium]